MAKTKKNFEVEVEDLSSVKKRLTITVPGEVVTNEFNSVYSRLKSTAAVSGFRKGNVPKNVLKAKFGDSINHDVSTKLVDDSYSNALERTGLAPIGKPEVELKDPAPEEGKDFSYSVTFEVTPKIEIDGYKGMVLDKQGAVEVSDEEIQKGLEELRSARTEFRDADRSARDGDIVNVDFEATRNGKPIKGIKAKDYPVIVGERGPLPGFAEAMKGLSKGAVKDISLTFPENYSEKDLAGQVAQFHVTVKGVKEKVVPELNDELAKGLNIDNLEKLKERVALEIKKTKEKQEKDRLKTIILDKLIEAHKLDVPGTLVEKYLTLILGNIADNMRSGIVAPEDRGLKPDALREKYKIVALRRALEDVVLDSIAAKEAVEISKEEIEAAIKDLAASRNMPFDALMSRIQREGTLEIIKDGLKHEKVFDLIINSAAG